MAQQHGDAEALTQALAGLCQLLLDSAPGQGASDEDSNSALLEAPEQGHLQSLLRRRALHSVVYCLWLQACHWCLNSSAVQQPVAVKVSAQCPSSA